MKQTFKLRKSKKFKNLCTVALLTVTLGGTISYAYANENSSTQTTAVTSETADKNNPVYKEIPGEKTEQLVIRTQQDLDNAIKRKGSDLSYGGLTFENTENLVFPAGVYKVARPTNWLFSEKSKGNIDFSKAVFLTTEDGNFQWEWHGDHSTNGKPQEIKGLTAYCTPYGSLNADFTHATPKFNAIHNLLVHTQNVTFKDWTVNAGLYFGTHTFDIMGSSNITVDNFTSQGMGVKAYTKEELEGINKNSHAQHSLFAEAVQIDEASYGASGMKDWSHTGLWQNDKPDLLPSSHITIKNSTFKGYNGKTGDAIIKGTNDTINLPYGATIGAHYVSNRPYKNITITNNTLDNTINFGKNAEEPAIDPIHMFMASHNVTTNDDLKTWNVSGNQITNYDGVRSGNATIKRNGQYITWTESDKQVTYKDETKTDEIPFKTVYKANPNTEAGKKTTIQKGENGVVTTKVTTKYVNGVKDESKSGTPETTKQAKDEVIEVGTKTKVETKTIPFERVTRDNDQLKQGETKVVQTGKDGKQTVTTTYELNTKTGEVVPKETTQNEPMTPEIVERGTMKSVETKPSETKPSDKKDDTKPSETKPSDKKDEVKPSETKPSETKPSETKPSETKPSETKPSETPKPSETKPSETPKSSDKKDEVKPSETPKPSDKKDETKPSEVKPSETPKTSESKPSETPKSSDKKDEVKPSETPKPSESKPSETPKSSGKKDETKPSEVKPSETPKSSDKKDEVKPSETPKSSDKKDEVKPSETKKSESSKSPDNSDKNKSEESKPELTDKSDKSRKNKSETKKLEDSKPKLTDNSENSKANKSTPESKSDVKPELTDKSKSSDNVDKPEVNKSIPKSKSDEKSDVKPDGQSSSLDNKSVNKSETKSAQNSAKQDLPKTNDVKVPLTISGVVLATAGFVALGYRKLFRKN